MLHLTPLPHLRRALQLSLDQEHLYEQLYCVHTIQTVYMCWFFCIRCLIFSFSLPLIDFLSLSLIINHFFFQDASWLWGDAVQKSFKQSKQLCIFDNDLDVLLIVLRIFPSTIINKLTCFLHFLLSFNLWAVYMPFLFLKNMFTTMSELLFSNLLFFWIASHNWIPCQLHCFS